MNCLPDNKCSAGRALLLDDLAHGLRAFDIVRLSTCHKHDSCLLNVLKLLHLDLQTSTIAVSNQIKSAVLLVMLSKIVMTSDAWKVSVLSTSVIVT